VSNRLLSVQELFFFPGTGAKFEGHFVVSSSDPGLAAITNEIKEATSEVPKYQLLLKVKNKQSYEITDCWINKFEKQNAEYTKCHFFCNDIERLD
jgi:hypothetical protein